MLLIVKAIRLFASLHVRIAQNSVPAVLPLDYILQVNRVKSRQLLKGGRQIFSPLSFRLSLHPDSLPGRPQRGSFVNFSQIYIRLHQKFHHGIFIIGPQNRRLHGKIIPGINRPVLRQRFCDRRYLPAVPIWKRYHISHLGRNRLSFNHDPVSCHSLLISHRPDRLLVAHGFLFFHHLVGADLGKAFFRHTIEVNIVTLLPDLSALRRQQIACVLFIFRPSLQGDASLHRLSSMLHGVLVGYRSVFSINRQLIALASGQLLDIIISRNQRPPNPAVSVARLVVLDLKAYFLIGRQAAVSSIRPAPGFLDSKSSSLFVMARELLIVLIQGYRVRLSYIQVLRPVKGKVRPLLNGACFIIVGTARGFRVGHKGAVSIPVRGGHGRQVILMVNDARLSIRMDKIAPGK